MFKIEETLERFKRVDKYEIIQSTKFVILLPFLLLYKVYTVGSSRKIILLSEDPKEASDNAYELFKYLVDKEVEDVYYAIDKDSLQYNKLKDYDDRVIGYGSFKHFFFYCSAYYNLSIHKASSPAASIFYILHKYNIFNGNRVFLQHGVTLNYVDYLKKSECNFKYFITASPKESDFVKKNLGYSSEEVKMLGFPRFDRLMNLSKHNNSNRIAIMPTWRKYLYTLNEEEFKETDYFISWQTFLDELSNLGTGSKEIEFIFYLHRNFLKFSHLFTSTSDNVVIASDASYNIQDLICYSKVLITDYSSISMDFSYINKPIIYFQFDKERFRNDHLSFGYFDYETQGFGPVVFETNELMDKLRELIKNDLQNDRIYLERSEEFFFIKDNNNCDRIYELLKEGGLD